MKLGVMAFNCSHGSTITTVPEAWKLNWPDTKDIAQAVDRSGMEALLPVGRWKGYGGPSNFNNCTFESFTWASAIGAVTNYCTVLATVHVPLVHPLMVAKMAATIDHVTDGRFAMNVVCGWFKNEFDMFGAHMRPHDDRYKYATEWLDFVRRAWTQDEEFDFNSESFNAAAVWSQPKPLQKPHPPIMNAGGSPAAQDFTTRYCDMNFVILKDRTHLPKAQRRRSIISSRWRARTGARPGFGFTSTSYAARPRRRPRTICNYYVSREGRLGGGRQSPEDLRAAQSDLGRQDAGWTQGAFHRRSRRLPAGGNGGADRRRARQARRYRRRRLPDLLGQIQGRACAVERGGASADGASGIACAVPAGADGRAPRNAVGARVA